MGGGASSLIRLRKAIIIRSYNLRKPDETVDQQFRRFASRGEDGLLLISLHNIKNCLEMESKEYEWVDHLFLRIFGGQVTTVNYADFIKFLESGKAPQATPRNDNDDMSMKNDTKAALNGTPPIPPSHMHRSSSHRSIADASAIRIEHLTRGNSSKGSLASLHGEREGLVSTADDGPFGDSAAPEGADEDEGPVMHINLSSAVLNPHSLPESVKLQSSDGFVPRSASRHGDEEDGDGGVELVEETLSLIVHPTNARKVSVTGSPAKPLWRKRETVRQERTVHYTTIDASGEQQELIEKETTQSEVLHMECKETGQFAHRETTQYEQLETFNEEVVAETKGAEEYVHLKSLEDEYHYMESTMPNKEERDGDGQQHDDHAPPQGAGDGTYGDPVDNQDNYNRYPGEGGEISGEEAAAAHAAMEVEYAEAYHLYHQKQKEQRVRGDGADEEEDAAGREMFSMSPRAPPPPFSDDAQQAHGFSAGQGPGRYAQGRGGSTRAMDAFAFAEEEDLREELLDETAAAESLHREEEGNGEGDADDAEQSQLFGDKIGTPPPPLHSMGHSRQGSGVRDKAYLFEPDTDVAPSPAVAAAAGSDVSALSTARSLPDDATAGAAAANQRDSYFSRTSSYESLHEID